MKWFVYCGTTYYPSHEIIEAETAEEAARESEWDGYPLAVFPFDALAFRQDGTGAYDRPDWLDPHE